MQLNSKRPLQTSQHELVFYQEFREEILGFTIQNNRVYYYGVAVYGVVDIYEALT